MTLARRLIPCLDVRDGRVVKGIQFEDLQDAGNPASLARRYSQAGADELVLLDISASQEGRATMLQTVREVAREVFIPLTVGGGIRTLDDIRAVLRAGADKVSINTAAVEQPDLLRRGRRSFGRQCMVAAIDARRRTDGAGDGGGRPSAWEVVTHGGTEGRGLDAVGWARRAAALGAGELLLTSMDRDGTTAGYDLALLRAVTAVVQLPVIASGGAGKPEHMVEAARCGADGLLAASVFHYDQYTIAAVKAHLHGEGVAVRRGSGLE